MLHLSNSFAFRVAKGEELVKDIEKSMRKKNTKKIRSFNQHLKICPFFHSFGTHLNILSQLMEFREKIRSHHDESQSFCLRPLCPCRTTPGFSIHLLFVEHFVGPGRLRKPPLSLDDLGQEAGKKVIWVLAFHGIGSMYLVPT